MGAVQTANQYSKLEQVLIQGDISKLTTEERVGYVNQLCNVMGLNPLTKPFDFIKFQGKEVCYATKNCAEQLRKIHRVSVNITGRELIDGIYVVTARARDATGKEDESTGAIPIENLKGADKANAMMKAETKAKRRVTLSICGLGMLDESELDTIPGAQKDVSVKPQQIAAKGQFDDDAKTALIKSMLKKFEGLGVSALEIVDYFDVQNVFELSDFQTSELHMIGSDLVNKRKTKEEVFGNAEKKL